MSDEFRLVHAGLVNGRSVLPPFGKTVSFDEAGVSEPVDAETYADCLTVPGYEAHAENPEIPQPEVEHTEGAESGTDSLDPEALIESPEAEAATLAVAKAERLAEAAAEAARPHVQHATQAAEPFLGSLDPEALIESPEAEAATLAVAEGSVEPAESVESPEAEAAPETAVEAPAEPVATEVVDEDAETKSGKSVRSK